MDRDNIACYVGSLIPVMWPFKTAVPPVIITDSGRRNCRIRKRRLRLLHFRTGLNISCRSFSACERRLNGDGVVSVRRVTE